MGKLESQKQTSWKIALEKKEKRENSTIQTSRGSHARSHREVKGKWARNGEGLKIEG